MHDEIVELTTAGIWIECRRTEIAVYKDQDLLFCCSPEVAEELAMGLIRATGRLPEMFRTGGIRMELERHPHD